MRYCYEHVLSVIASIAGRWHSGMKMMIDDKRLLARSVLAPNLFPPLHLHLASCLLFYSLFFLCIYLTYALLYCSCASINVESC